MEKLIDVLAEQSLQLNKTGQDVISKLMSKIKTFSHCPLNVKHAERMKPFVDEQTVDFISGILLDRPFPLSNHVTFSSDIVTYFYCLALISFSEKAQTVETLQQITQKMIDEKYNNLYLAERNFNFFKHRPELQDLVKKLNQQK